MILDKINQVGSDTDGLEETTSTIAGKIMGFVLDAGLILNLSPLGLGLAVTRRVQNKQNDKKIK